MNTKKLCSAIQKAFFRVAVIFSICIVLLAVCLKIEGGYIEPLDVIILFGMFFILAIITAVRIYLDGSRWSLKLPFYIKNVMVAPIYLLVTLGSLLSLSGMSNEKKENAVLIVVIFIITFVISTIIKYIMAKKKTDEMNDALLEFKEEHFNEEG